MVVVIAAEAGHRGKEEAQGYCPERYAVGTACQARPGRRVAALACSRSHTGLAARHGLALWTTGDEHGLAAVTLFVIRSTEAVVPAGVSEGLGPVRDLDCRSLDPQVLDHARRRLLDHVKVALGALGRVQICV